MCYAAINCNNVFKMSSVQDLVVIVEIRSVQKERYDMYRTANGDTRSVCRSTLVPNDLVLLRLGIPNISRVDVTTDIACISIFNRRINRPTDLSNLKNEQKDTVQLILRLSEMNKKILR